MTNDVWTVQAALDWTVGYLGRKGDENPRLSAEWLIGEACGMSRVELYVNFDRPLSPDERAVLRGYVSRRGAGEPLQYITGEVAFRHITVKVEPGVLIPRPETEVLVSVALSLLPPERRRRAVDSTMTPDETAALLAAAVAMPHEGAEPAHPQAMPAGAVPDAAGTSVALAHPAPLLVADICTGSGCIACSLAHERSDVRVIATDVAPAAVSLATRNACRLGLQERVSVIACDLGEGVDVDLAGSFDLVASNPPYVPTAVLRDVPREVSDFEPALALDGGPDGLDVFRRLAAWCMIALKPGGGFAFELHETCLDTAREYARGLGFTHLAVDADLAGRPRVLSGRKPA